MGYGHAERNLALIRQLEAETRELLGTLDQQDPEQSAWVAGGHQPRKAGGSAVPARNSNGANQAGDAAPGAEHQHLTAIGAAPHSERPNFPILSRRYVPRVQIALVPFGKRALRHVIYLERPVGWRWTTRPGLWRPDGSTLVAAPASSPRGHGRAAPACLRTAGPSHWLASRASSRCRRFSPTGRPRLSSALCTRYWTVFLCSVRRSAVAL
jgi:hypothetical protein